MATRSTQGEAVEVRGKNPRQEAAKVPVPPKPPGANPGADKPAKSS